MAKILRQIVWNLNHFVVGIIYVIFKKLSRQSNRTQLKISLPNSSRNVPQKSQKGLLNRRRTRIWHGLGSIVVFLSIILSHSPHIFGVANAATVIQFPLSTNGAKIVDAKGTTVLLRGVNWFGIETETHAPHGLWLRDYKDMLAQIKQQGYNIIRLPYSVQALSSTNISGVDFSIGSNQELYGKTPLEVMDLVIAEAQKQGLMILLDSHRLQDYSATNPNMRNFGTVINILKQLGLRLGLT
jgi:endoglucanase